MVITCGFEESRNGNPREFNHMQRYEELHKLIKKIRTHRANSIIATFLSREISRADFDSLGPRTSITYGALDFAYAYLQSLASSRACANRILLVTTTVCNEIIVGDKLEAIECLVERSFTFLPIECPDGDWSLLVLCLPHKKAFYYNTNSECRKGFFLATTILERVKTNCKFDLELVELNAPQQRKRCDSGILICEMTALLVRRLVQAKPSHRLSLGLGGTSFIVGAGRTLLQTLVLGLYNNKKQGSVTVAKVVQIADYNTPRRVSSHRFHSQTMQAMERAAALKRAEETANEVWKSARKNTIQEKSKDSKFSYSNSAPKGWWSKLAIPRPSLGHGVQPAGIS